MRCNRAQIAWAVRFSLREIFGAVIPAANISRSCFSSAAVQRRPALSQIEILVRHDNSQAVYSEAACGQDELLVGGSCVGNTRNPAPVYEPLPSHHSTVSVI